MVYFCCLLGWGARVKKDELAKSTRTRKRERLKKKKKKKKKSCVLTSWQHQDCNVIFSSRCLC